MEEKNEQLQINEILCKECNEIKKIKINCDFALKSISISFECGHERNNQNELKGKTYCLNCNKNVMNKMNCQNASHTIIKKEYLYFYCKAHLKKFDSYCEKCKSNLCENCDCPHENSKNRYEYYFSLSQLEELISIYNEVQNYINSNYSLDINKMICKEFVTYYNIYIYIYNDLLFHANIIYNISLFYDFFKFLMNTKLIVNGCFSISEINTIVDNTIFFDEKFNEQFGYLMDMKKFNFNNVMELFCLSKRFKIKKELFSEFSNKMYSYISKSTSKLDDIEKNIMKIRYYLNLYREGINSKKNIITKLESEIRYELLSIKLSKIAIPSNLKRKLSNILQRAIIKKYKDYLHKVKPNLFILNNIKKRYDTIKKSNNKLYKKLNFDTKVKEVDIVKPDDSDNFVDNVYFEKDFELKGLLNTFIYFSQKLRYQKSNETHYSKKNVDKSLTLNQLLLDKNYSKDKQTSKNNNINNEAGKLSNKPVDNSMNQTNNISIMCENDIIYNEELNDYQNFLEEIKNKFNDYYKDIFIKETINLTYIVDALFKNDFSEIIEISDNNKNNDNVFDNLIDNCLNQLNNIKYEKNDDEKQIDDLYSKIENNSSQKEAGNIFSSLIKNRNYKNVLLKIKENCANNNQDNIKPLYDNLEELLVNSGGIDERNANQILEIIISYLSNIKEIQELEKTMKTNQLLFKQIACLSLEVEQLKIIKNHIIKISGDLKEEDNNYSELKELDMIKESFEKNVDKYIKNSIDNNFQKALKEIKEFVK